MGQAFQACAIPGYATTARMYRDIDVVFNAFVFRGLLVCKACVVDYEFVDVFVSFHGLGIY